MRSRFAASLALIAIACSQAPKPAPQKASQAVPAVPKENGMLSRKPYLTVKIDGEKAPFEVFVNGGYVTTDMTAMVSNETWPVNQFLRSGPNQLAILLYPMDEPPNEFAATTKVSVKLQLQEAGSLDKPATEIATLVFDAAAATPAQRTAASTADGQLDSTEAFARVRHGDVVLGPVQVQKVDDTGLLLISREITMPLPFPEWAFLRSDRAKPAYEATEGELLPDYEKLLAAYESIWKLLQAKDVDKLMPLFEERSRELDLAMYLPEGTTQAKLKDSFERTFNDSTRKLDPVILESGMWTYGVGPIGTLRRLSWGRQGAPVLHFPSTTDETYFTGYPVMFRKSGDKYIVSR